MIRYARARPRPEPGTMNRLESEWSGVLELRKRAGEILDWRFEPFKLRLAKKTTYSPDFAVVYPDGVIEVQELKGFWEDDARVKTKIAAETFWWFRFVGIQKVKGQWMQENFGEADE